MPQLVNSVDTLFGAEQKQQNLRRTELIIVESGERIVPSRWVFVKRFRLLENGIDVEKLLSCFSYTGLTMSMIRSKI